MVPPVTDSGATPVPELSGGRHFPCLDAYRGLAMIMILVTHASFATGFTQRSWLGDYFARLDIAVPMFFVLSGFLLYRPYALSQLHDRPQPASGRFYRRRALRILPAYWVAVIGVVALFGFVSIDGIWAWVANLLFLPAVGVDEPYAISQAWSVGVEVSFYALLPLYATATGRLAARRPGAGATGTLLRAAGVLYLLGMLFRITVVIVDPGWVDQSLVWLPMYVDLFALGMGLAVASAAGTGEPLTNALRRIAGHPGLCWLAAFAVFVLVAQMEPPDHPFGLSGPEYLPRQFGFGVASVLWILPGMFGDQTEGRLRRALASRPLVYLGLISYSFYLWHLAWVEQAKVWTVPDYDSLVGLQTFQGNVLVVTVLAFASTFIVASIVLRLVELPFLRLKDRPFRTLLPSLRTEERAP